MTLRKLRGKSSQREVSRTTEQEETNRAMKMEMERSGVKKDRDKEIRNCDHRATRHTITHTHTHTHTHAQKSSHHWVNERGSAVLIAVASPNCHD